MTNKYFSFLIIGLLAVLLSSCSKTPQKNKAPIVIDSIIYKPGTKEPFTGTWKGEMDSVKISFGVVNGKKEGKYETYYPNGQLLMSGQMKNNKNVGEWKYFYSNGNLESSGIFENDKAQGLWSWYYPDGSLRQTGYFDKGVRDSIWKTYDNKGSLIDSVAFDADTTKPRTSF